MCSRIRREREREREIMDCLCLRLRHGYKQLLCTWRIFHWFVRTFRFLQNAMTHLVLFCLQDSNEMMVVASNWLTSDKKQCYWPPFKSPEKCMKAVKDKELPITKDKLWEKLNIVVLGEYATFEEAKEKKDVIKKRLSASAADGIREQKLYNILELPINEFQVPAAPSVSTSTISTDAKDELLQMLREIKNSVQENSDMLRKLLKDNQGSEVPTSTSMQSRDVKPNLNLPLRTLEDVTRIEKQLTNAATRKKYVKHLSELGGFGPKEVIKNIMQNVLIDDLAKQFSWQGRGDKKALSQLTLANVIKDGACCKRMLSREDCENEIKKYLSCVADRINRKRPKEFGGPEAEKSDDCYLLDSPPKIGMTFFSVDYSKSM